MTAAPPPIIALIGMMGAGKSTVGKLLSRACDLEFVDADRELEHRSGVAIATIFELEGEDGFRKREAALIDELTQRPGIVLATGGGAVLRDDNRQHLRERTLVIYLQASADEIERRTAHDRSRPLLQTDDPGARIRELLKQREPLYAETAHLAFPSSTSNPRKLVKRMLEHPRVRSHVGERVTQVPD
jgi:shikimate kinase